MICRLILLAALILTPSSALAWSFKEHVQFTRLAAMLLIEDPQTPPEMKDWLKANIPDLTDWETEKQFLLHGRIGRVPQGLTGLSYWSIRPDQDRDMGPKDAVVEPWGVGESLLHFTDLEFFTTDHYADDLSAMPAVGDVPRDPADPRWKRAGMLPFRLEQSYQQLVRCFAEQDVAAQGEGDEDFAARWAGYLAHYAQDNTQPQHMTVDYKSASYFAGVAKPPNVHAEMEYRMLDSDDDDFADLRAAYWPMFEQRARAGKLTPVDDPWLSTLVTGMSAYRCLPAIGHAAAAAYDAQTKRFDTRVFFNHKDWPAGPSVLELKAAQAATAVHRTAALWRAAWDEAHPAK